MPVHRYRSVEEAEALAAAPLDPENLRRALAWSAFCRRLYGWTASPGVFHYRTIEDAAAAREEWERAARSEPS